MATNHQQRLIQNILNNLLYLSEKEETLQDADIEELHTIDNMLTAMCQRATGDASTTQPHSTPPNSYRNPLPKSPDTPTPHVLPSPMRDKSTHTSEESADSPDFQPSVQYHGLHNKGSTCYLNSVLQVLYRTEGFREAVERHCRKNPMDVHLHSLFTDLETMTANTKNIIMHLDIKVNEQQDAAEYFEKILNLISPDVSQIFRGELTHKTICSCKTEKGSQSSFWHLPLVLGDSDSEFYSVEESIENFFSCKSLTRENQRYCNSCNAKTDTTMKRILNNHPEVLTLLLKRFTYDYTYRQYIKINRTVIVPYTLHIPENQTYELYAVVDHFGSLRGGHYSATINVNGEWYTFNDSSVRKTWQVEQKSSSACLLFYKKTKADDGTLNIHEVSTGNLKNPATDATNEDEEHAKKNDRSQMHRNVKDQHSYKGRKMVKDEESVGGTSKAPYQAREKQNLAQGTDCGRTGKQHHIGEAQDRHRVETDREHRRDHRKDKRERKNKIYK